MSSCYTKGLSCFFCLALVAIAAALAIHYLGDEDDPKIPFLPTTLPNVTIPNIRLPTIDDFRLEDPFGNVQNPDDANKWKNEGKGLRLNLVNALDEQWVAYFGVAVAEWNNGSPDSLDLTTEVADEPDSECTGITGMQKVCNGDYGETDWKGINKVLLQNGWIITSMARMNDYFFVDGDADKRQYTMCHELGHGFGLPHTDESFWNRDLGNCLDYTNNFSGNKSPDETNFQFLADLYGVVGGTAVSGAENGAENSTENGTENDTESGTENGEFGGRSRQLRGQEHSHLFESVKSKTRRAELLSILNGVDSLVDYGFGGSAEAHGWRQLHRTRFGRSLELDIGDGYTIQIHMLNS